MTFCVELERQTTTTIITVSAFGTLVALSSMLQIYTISIYVVGDWGGKKER